MRYLLMIFRDESTEQWSPEEGQQLLAEYVALSNEMRSAGAYQSGERLQPTDTATTVRIRNGETIITDGPFAETKEQFGGFYLVDCKDLDQALDYAAKIPGARFGSIEVRPVWEM